MKKVEENKKKLNQIRAKKMDMSLEDYVEQQEQETAKLRREEEKEEEKEKKKTRDWHDEEIDRLKHIKDFEEDLLKAELISKQFEL